MNKYIVRRLMCGLCCIVTAFALSGCATGVEVLHKDASATLPPASVAWSAPVGDTEQETAQTVLIYVPNSAGTQLIAQAERVAISAARHPAEAALRRLFAFAGSDTALRLGPESTLQLSPVNPVEISGDTAVVNLASSAFMLSHSDLYIVCQAIANTLSQWGDIHYVNVLVSSAQPGLDVGASVPAGCFTEDLNGTIDTLAAAVEAQTAVASDRRISLNAVLYFPTYAGKGILAEAQTISFDGRSKPVLAETLLAALSQGARQLTNVPSLPVLSEYLISTPTVQEIPVSGGQRIILRFSAELNEALIEARIPRSVMLAALTYTITGFIPGIGGITVYIGDELVTAVVPNGIYEGAGEAVIFADGVMRRSDFSRFLLSNCTLYMGDGSGSLRAVQRPIPYYETRSARYLLGCLMQGPQTCDSESAQAVLPEGLSDADLLGVGLSDYTLLLNWSSRFGTLAKNLDETAERLLVFSIVNTLTELPPVHGVSLFIDGEQPETLSGRIYLPGQFMRDAGLIGK
ncbi:MAG: GerMN domain-containing protein [Clostridia bacterium]|nr:GerMN domain-containing protein [Clostridia bacterium]